MAFSRKDEKTMLLSKKCGIKARLLWRYHSSDGRTLNVSGCGTRQAFGLDEPLIAIRHWLTSAF
jgi:hypothetical protein